MSAASSAAPADTVVSPATICGTDEVSIALAPTTLPAASNSVCSVRVRPRESKFSVAKPSGLMRLAWQPAQPLSGCSVSSSTTSRVVISSLSSGGLAAALLGGGGTGSHSSPLRRNTPFMIGRVLLPPLATSAARVSRPTRAGSSSTGGSPPAHGGDAVERRDVLGLRERSVRQEQLLEAAALGERGPRRHVDDLGDHVVRGVGAGLEVAADRVEQRRADERVHRREVVEPQPLAVELAERDLGAGIREQPIHLRGVALVGEQRPRLGRRDELVVGHRLPEVIREPGRDLVARQPVAIGGVGDGRIAVLDEVEELRRDEHHRDDVGERLGIHALRRPVAVVDAAIERELVGLDRAPHGPGAEAGDEVVEARVVVGRVGIGRARADEGGAAGLRGDELGGHGDRHVVGRVDVLLVDGLIEATEPAVGLAGDRLARVVGDRREERLDLREDRVDVAGRRGDADEIRDRRGVLELAQATQRQLGGERVGGRR
jgi:hypothetical protein